jgi:hypothetical protein
VKELVSETDGRGSPILKEMQGIDFNGSQFSLSKIKKKKRVPFLMLAWTIELHIT